MDDTLIGHGNGTAVYDYREYDRIWQRVAPELNPYPEVRLENSTPNGLEQLPGAAEDPCCMGSAAKDSLEVIAGFMEDELAGKRLFLCFAGRVPGERAARVLRQIAGQKDDHLRRLMAAYYLVTGELYRCSIQMSGQHRGGYCAMLRSAYHEVSCMWLNYLRAADGTGDPCLQKLFRQMGENSRQHVEQILHLLSRSIC